MNQSRRDIDEIKERISTLEQVLQDDIHARDHAQHEETIHQIAERRRSMLPQTQQQQSLGENLSLYPICITVILNLHHQLRQAIGHISFMTMQRSKLREVHLELRNQCRTESQLLAKMRRNETSNEVSLQYYSFWFTCNLLTTSSSVSRQYPRHASMQRFVETTYESIKERHWWDKGAY